MPAISEETNTPGAAPDTPKTAPNPPRRRWRPWFFLALTLLVLLSVGWPVARTQNYLALLRYEPDQDFQYNLEHTGGKRLEVEVTADGLRWPSDTEHDDSGFLRLDVRATWLGQVLDPYLEYRAGGVTYRQYLDRDLDGIRYFNLSPLVAAKITAGQFVSLKGTHLTWEPQLAQLALYASAPAANERILVVAPHPDDAEIAAFGLYRRRDAYLVTVTAGEAGDLFYEPISEDQRQRRRTKAKLRIWDSLSVPLWAGLSPDRSINLGYPDGKLALLHEHPDKALVPASSRAGAEGKLKRWQLNLLRAGRRSPATWNNLVSELAEVLRGVSPTVIVAPHPLLDNHPDHVHTTMALLEALEQANLRKGKLYLYTNHHVVTEIYPFGPTGSMVALPPWFKGGWLFESLYSKPLAPEVQSEKYFALEAMHDLRSSTVDDEAPWERVRSGLTKAYEAMFKMSEPGSYYRRAVKANELFFVVPLRLAPRLAHLTAESLAAGSPQPPWTLGKKKRLKASLIKNKGRSTPSQPPSPGAS